MGLTTASRPTSVHFTNSTPADNRDCPTVTKMPIIKPPVINFDYTEQIPPVTNQDCTEQFPPVNQSIADHTLELMCGQLALSRIPVGEPAVFDGKNSLAFPLWNVNFDALTSNKAMSATDRVIFLVGT